MHYSSKLIERAVEEIAKLPGIGKKSALRIVLHLLKQDPKQSHQLAEALIQLRDNIQYCRECHNIADEALCYFCKDTRRRRDIICVVEHFKDIAAIERTGHYHGLYHVLGGLISPIDGVGPQDIHIESLLQRVRQGEVTEVILALSSTMEGDTTAFYLTKRLKEQQVKVTALARGVPIGSELEFTDELTLTRSLLGRTEF
ncbi:recombination protein RecR [Thermonema lapsum]|uniref:Recombination protein RecR n=1 Tax=Thermonema lapsum TaxID=28195 RepID=A0A846MRJ1_9BACT|nr:recombination mediator RecR [Thermonema lapsum]NIK74079.1 recombination protein RecR [Thermonema lapsum]